MPTCKNCLHVELCKDNLLNSMKGLGLLNEQEIIETGLNNQNRGCEFFKDSSKFVELKSAQWVKHKPEIEKMREFHKLGIGKAMSENSIFWTCSICGGWGNLSQKYCSNCGAKMEAKHGVQKENEQRDSRTQEIGGNLSVYS